MQKITSVRIQTLISQVKPIVAENNVLDRQKPIYQKQNVKRQSNEKRINDKKMHFDTTDYKSCKYGHWV